MYKSPYMQPGDNNCTKTMGKLAALLKLSGLFFLMTLVVSWVSAVELQRTFQNILVLFLLIVLPMAVVSVARRYAKDAHQNWPFLNILSTLSLCLPIDARVSAEKQQIERLVRQLNDANIELALARESALDSPRVDNEFISTIGHELATPLSSILGMLGLIESSELSENNNALLMAAEEIAQELLLASNDLIDYSRIDAGTVNINEDQFQVTDIVDNIISTHNPAALRKKICIVADVEPNIPLLKGDAEKLKRILNHLVDNAVKFTHRGGVQIRVTPTCDLTGMLKLQFSVSDTGIGIASKEAGKLFHPFSRIRSNDKCYYRGLGIGLVLTRKLVELLGGKLAFSSIEGKGTTFYCTVSFVIVDQPNTQPPPGQSPNGFKLNRKQKSVASVNDASPRSTVPSDVDQPWSEVA